LEYNDDILYVEYESFSYEFDVNKSLDVGLYVEYEFVSFDPKITDLLFESRMFEFIESENIVTKNFDLDQTLAHFDRKGLVDLGPPSFPRQFVHDHKISRPVTHLLAKFEYVYLFPDWAQQFDKLKQTLMLCSTIFHVITLPFLFIYLLLTFLKKGNRKR